MGHSRTVNVLIALIFAMVLALTGCQQAGPKLSEKKAEQSLKSLNPETDAKIKEVRPTPIKGVYEVIAEDKDGRFAIVYMSGDGKYLVSRGFLIDVDKKENMTLETEFEITKVDFSSIPIANSIILGDPEGQNKVFVFSDPSCLPCAFYHEELKKAARENESLTIYLKLFALPNLYPNSYQKARAIYCAKNNEEALTRLDTLYASEEIPYPDCKTSAVDENMALVSKLNISRSPTTIFPNGVKISELMRADDFIKELEKRGGSPVASKSAAGTDGQSKKGLVNEPASVPEKEDKKQEQAP